MLQHSWIFYLFIISIINGIKSSGRLDFNEFYVFRLPIISVSLHPSKLSVCIRMFISNSDMYVGTLKTKIQLSTFFKEEITYNLHTYAAIQRTLLWWTIMYFWASMYQIRLPIWKSKNVCYDFSFLKIFLKNFL